MSSDTQSLLIVEPVQLQAPGRRHAGRNRARRPATAR